MIRAPLSQLSSEERTVAFAGFASFAMILAGHELLETARDALFLASIPATRLPFIYIAIAFLGIAVARRLETRRWSDKNRDCRPVSMAAMMASGVSIGIWLLLGNPSPWMLYALYIWTGVSTAIIVVQIWNLISEAFTPTRAKRAFPFIATGGVTGAIFGSAIARTLAEVTEPRHLVVAGAGLFLLAAFLAIPRLHGEAMRNKQQQAKSPERPERGSFLESAAEVFSNGYARHLALLAIFGSLTLTVADFVLKAVVAEQIAAEELASFFATLNLATNGVSLVIQLFVVDWVVRRFNSATAVAVLPAVCIAGALIVAGGAGLVGAIAFFGAGATMSHSIYRTANELLFVPLSSRLRRHAKALIDIGANRGGKALASIVLLAMAAVDAPIWMFGSLGALLAAVWLGGAIHARWKYLEHFRSALRGALLDPRLELPALDLDSLEVLVAALNDPDDKRVIAALETLNDEERAGLIPALILYHPSIEVVNAALSVMVPAGRTDIVPVADRIIQMTDNSTRRARLIVARTILEPDRELLEEHVAGACPLTAGVSGMMLATHGWMEPTEADRVIRRTITEGTIEQKVVLAEASRVGGRQTANILEELLLDADINVVRSTLTSIRQLQIPELLSNLLDALRGPHWRDVARTISSYGDKVVPMLEDALDDHELGRVQRRRLVVALAQVPGSAGVLAIQRRLQSEPDGAVRYRMVRELEHQQLFMPEFKIDRSALDAACQRLRTEALNHVGFRQALEQGAPAQTDKVYPVHELLIALLRGREQNLAEVFLRIEGLRRSGFDSRRIVDGAKSDDLSLRSSALELIDSVLPGGDARITLVLLGASQPQEISGRLAVPVGSYRDVVERLRDELGSDTVRAVCDRLARELPPAPVPAPETSAVTATLRPALSAG